MKRLYEFFAISIVNFLLLGLYTVICYFEWCSLLRLPLVATVNWTPLRTHIAYVGGTRPLVNGILLIDNWSFIVLLAIIVVNLISVWKIEHKDT